MICPRCRYEQSDATECIKCGVVVNKFIDSHPEEFVPPKKIPNRYTRDDTYKKVYSTTTKSVDISPFKRRLAYAVIVLILGYVGMVYATNSMTKDALGADIKTALETSLRHKFNSEVLAGAIVKIGAKNKVEIALHKVKIEFAPIYGAEKGLKINYRIKVMAPYTKSFFSFGIKTNIYVTVEDYMSNSGIEAMRLKGLLGID